ncbi:MAG: HIT domain-containing protein [Gammaproteobacteria bacterium]
MSNLHPRLAADCHILGKLPLSHVLLMDESRYPWLILVPDRDHISEPWQLAPEDQIQLSRESMALGQLMQQRLGADKMNIAALGNVVPQLHVHHIARFSTDPAWPKPVWGLFEPLGYGVDLLADLKDRLELTQLDGFTAA